MEEPVAHGCLVNDAPLGIMNNKRSIGTMTIFVVDQFSAQHKDLVFKVPLKRLYVRLIALAATKRSPRSKKILHRNNIIKHAVYAIHEAPVFQKTFDLLCTFHKMRRAFPKQEKYTLGETIETTLLELLAAIVEAGYAKKPMKLAPIQTAMAKANFGKILYRLAHAMDILPEKQYLAAEEQLQSIGEMLGGWQRAQ